MCSLLIRSIRLKALKKKKLSRLRVVVLYSGVQLYGVIDTNVLDLDWTTGTVSGDAVNCEYMCMIEFWCYAPVDMQTDDVQT